MPDQIGGADQPQGFLEKRISLRWTLILLGIVVLAGVILWAIKALECGSIASRCDQTVRNCTAQAAENMARAIAVVGNQQIADEKYESLQEYADELVKDKAVAYIAIVDTRGRAVVHTDRSLLRKKWREPKEGPGVVPVSVPVMRFTKQVATVHVGMKLD